MLTFLSLLLGLVTGVRPVELALGKARRAPTYDLLGAGIASCDPDA
ncbi:MAG: hypothetical protein ACHQJD_05860 [Thermoanaerobaculia bacterium]